MRRLVAVFCAGLTAVLASCQTPPPDDAQIPAGTRELRDLEYARPGGEPLRLDLFVPPGNHPMPLVIWVHGGGWYEGDRGDIEGLPLLRYGYALASVDYRLSDEALFPAQIHDVKAAVRYLRANAVRFGLDGDRFGAWGESAGGHLVALLGTTSVRGELEGNEGVTGVSSRVQAVADWFGPTDLVRRRAQTPKDALDPDSPESTDYRLLGGAPSRNRAKAERASPTTYVAAGAPPFFIVHGDDDDMVPLAQSTLLVEALRRVNVPVEFKVVEGGGHGGDEYYSAAMLAQLRDFFDRTLKGGNRH